MAVDKDEATVDSPEVGTEATAEETEATSPEIAIETEPTEVKTDATGPAKLPDAEEVAAESGQAIAPTDEPAP